MGEVSDVLNRFESLGDNCEFGFVQRKHGLEAGGLLRWAIAPIEPLINALDHQFIDFYRLDELAPSADDMVLAKRYGLYFHSSLRSKVVGGQREFVADRENREELYNTEIVKMNYLLKKLIERLEQGSFIFVYKDNNSVSEENSRKLYAALKRFNNNNQLLVILADAALPPTRRIEEGLYCGYIERFAPYACANDASYDRWLTLCTDAVALSAEEQTARTQLAEKRPTGRNDLPERVF